MQTYRQEARWFGVFFLLTFFSYGIGSAMVDGIMSSAQGLSDIQIHKPTFLTGGLMMALAHTLFNMGLAVIMFQVVCRVNRYLAFGYLSAAMMSTLMLLIGAVFLLLLLRLGEAPTTSQWDDLIQVAHALNFYCYQLGMSIWGIGGMMLCYMLFQSRLVPRWLAVWGFLGYAIFVVGTVLEVAGYPVGLYLSGPGGLFEVVLSIWLIARGFGVKPRSETSLIFA